MISIRQQDGVGDWTYSVLHTISAESLLPSLGLGRRGRRQEGCGNFVGTSRVQRLGILLGDLGRRHGLHRGPSEQARLRRIGNARVHILRSSCSVSGNIICHCVYRCWDRITCRRGSGDERLRCRSGHAGEREAAGVGGYGTTRFCGRDHLEIAVVLEVRTGHINVANNDTHNPFLTSSARVGVTVNTLEVAVPNVTGFAPMMGVWLAKIRQHIAH
jgi:hypothetical protein